MAPKTITLGAAVAATVSAAVLAAAISWLAARRSRVRPGGPPRVEPSERMHPGGPLRVETSVRPPDPPARPYVPYRSGAPFHQVGFVHDAARGVRAPLHGRPAPRNPARWQYFVRADDAAVRAPVRSRGAVCMGDTGCEELQTGDHVSVPELFEGVAEAHVYEHQQG